MEFLNPAMFWGILAVSIPILIHLWHQKQGKVLPWATTRWLNEKDIQQSRSLKLDNLLLLFLRVLILILMVLLFARPQLQNTLFPTEKVHWVEPSEVVLSNFKFELNEAQKKGEKLFWLNGEPIKEIIAFENNTQIQEGINKITEQLNGSEKAELYISSPTGILEKPQVFIPIDFHLNFAKNTPLPYKPNYIALSGQNKLFINETGELVSSNQPFNYPPVLDHSLQVLIPKSNTALKAAMLALKDVYKLNFEIDTLATNSKHYDVAISETFQPNTELNIIYNTSAIPLAQKKWSESVFYINENLNDSNADLIFNAALPEKILEILISHLKLEKKPKNLTIKQLKNRFNKQANSINIYDTRLATTILILLILVIGLERWLSITRNI